MPVALPVAILGSAAIGAVASSSASKKATKAATDAANQNNALQQDIYNRNTAALAPYTEAGSAATPAIQALLGIGRPDRAQAQMEAFDNWRNAAGYQDQFAEGQRAVTGALSRGGFLDSGEARKAFTRYGQGQANQSLGQYMGYLTGQQNVGLNAASAQAGIGQNYANSVGANNNYAAETTGNAALAGAGSINQALGTALSAYGLYKGMGSSYGSRGALGGSGYPGTPPYVPPGIGGNNFQRGW
jgi:hypothetical protein